MFEWEEWDCAFEIGITMDNADCVFSMPTEVRSRNYEAGKLRTRFPLSQVLRSKSLMMMKQRREAGGGHGSENDARHGKCVACHVSPPLETLALRKASFCLRWHFALV